MKIKNITSKVQTLWLLNLLRGESFQVQVLPTEPREISKEYIPDRSKNINFDKNFEIIGNSLFFKSEEINEDNDESAKEDIVEESNNKEDENSKESEEVDVKTEGFICDECGAEFASARGLAAHKSKSHDSN